MVNWNLQEPVGNESDHVGEVAMDIYEIRNWSSLFLALAISSMAMLLACRVLVNSAFSFLRCSVASATVLS